MDEQPGRDPSRPHRPSPYADLTGFIDAAGGVAPHSHAELASATAALLVQVGREEHDAPADPGDPAGSGASADSRDAERFVALADRAGLDTLAALWRDSDPVSLPGSLWALYLLRQWFQSNGEEVWRLWRAGSPLAPADSVVAGVPEPQGVPEVQGAADAVLAGVYRGDLAVALERAAALFRVMGTGRRALAESTGDADRQAADLDLAARNDRVAADLASAASRWRAGTLH